ncbi:MAG TPA: sugar ABC transporter substrate-binding protein [Pyrinomonadaceae bacterium]|nr:sugar ABC transporter substrate-binding protein [Pyrinomonadaceae bacterium]
MAHNDASDGLSDHPQAVYTPPPGLDAALDHLPLIEVGAGGPKRIGYLTNYSFHIWYQILIEIIRRRAAQYGATVTVLDAELSVERQIQQAQQLFGEADALILTPAATEGLESIVASGADRKIPVVVEANPVEGMKTLVAICDYDAGFALGMWVGQHLRTGKPLRVLDMGLPTLRPCLLRSEGFIDGLRSIQSDAAFVARLNGEGSKIIAKRLAAPVCASEEVDVIFAMDDETGQGALEAYLDAGRDQNQITLATFGLAGNHEKDLLTAGGPLKVGAAMFPEYVAVRCVDNVMRIHAGHEVNRRDVIPSIPVTADILPKYYPKTDGVWTPDLQAVAALPTSISCVKE